MKIMTTLFCLLMLVCSWTYADYFEDWVHVTDVLILLSPFTCTNLCFTICLIHNWNGLNITAIIKDSSNLSPIQDPIISLETMVVARIHWDKLNYYWSFLWRKRNRDGQGDRKMGNEILAHIHNTAGLFYIFFCSFHMYFDWFSAALSLFLLMLSF